MEQLAQHLADLLPRNASVLDVGTGDGSLAQRIGQLRPDVTLRGIDLLVSDAVMPGMAGMELARQLRLERPGLPILFVSGWAGESFERDWAGEPAVDLLLKPFEVAELLERVGRLLEHRPARDRRAEIAPVG